MTRGRWILTIFVAGSLTTAGALTYKRWPQLLREDNKQKTTSSATPDGLLSIPPFSTKEPERYQATRVITSVEYKNGSGSAPVSVTNKILIARDGDKRREEFQTAVNETVVYLETPQGRFVLSPAKRLYADLDPGSGDLSAFNPLSDGATADQSSGPATPGTADFSPERLLNETRAPARYEKLGAETINDRAATKYRVTSGDETNGTAVGSVTLIWIDDTLGLPIRTETRSTTSNSSATLTVELRDLKQEVDPRMFELPKDYQKVDYRRLLAESSQVSAASGGKSKS